MSRIKPLRIQAVAFDLDGTLIDSMGHHADAWSTVLSRHGYRFNRDLYLRSEGIPLRTLIPTVVEPPLKDLELLEGLILAKDQIYGECNEKVPLVDFGRELIVLIKALGLPVGLVTAGQRDRVSRTLFREDIALFDAVICGDDSIHGKPLPHPYLKAAEIFGIFPQNLLVIENAVCGAVSSYLANAALIYVGYENLKLPNQLATCVSIEAVMKVLQESEWICEQSSSLGS